MLFDDYRDPDALELLEEWKPVQASETVVPLSAIAGRRQSAVVSQE
jgi:hypothetical protein